MRFIEWLPRMVRGSYSLGMRGILRSRRVRSGWASTCRQAAILALAMSVAQTARAQATITLRNSVNSSRPAVTNPVCLNTSVETNVAVTTPLETTCNTSFLTNRSVARGSFIGSTLSLATYSTITSLVDYFVAHEWSRAEATFRDTVTATWNGFGRFSWQVQAAASCSPNCTPSGSDPSAGVGLSVNGIAFTWGPDGVSTGVFGPGVVTLDVPVVAGVPLDLTVAMMATAWIESTRAGYSATADFSNGATLMSVTPLDSNKQPVVGALVSNAGLTYPTPATTPVAQIQSLIGAIDDLVAAGRLKTGPAQGLKRPLDNVLRSLGADRIVSACSQLDDFEGEVTSKVLDGSLEASDGQSLIQAAETIRAGLGC